MYAARLCFVLLFVICASDRLVAAQENLFDGGSLMQKMSSGVSDMGGMFRDFGGSMWGRMSDGMKQAGGYMTGQVLPQMQGVADNFRSSGFY